MARSLMLEVVEGGDSEPFDLDWLMVALSVVVVAAVAATRSLLRSSSSRRANSVRKALMLSLSYLPEA